MPRTVRSDDAMSKSELAALKRRLGMLAPAHVDDEYIRVLSEIQLRPLPGPRLVQEFVALWKARWDWQGRTLEKDPFF
jgi:hypothetical protein